MRGAAGPHPACSHLSATLRSSIWLCCKHAWFVPLQSWQVWLKGRLRCAQVFPYFYVPYDDDLPADPAAAHTYLRDLAQGIEIAMRANSQVSPTCRVIVGITASSAAARGALFRGVREVVSVELQLHLRQ